MTIAMFGHPFRAGQMAFIYSTGAIRLRLGVDVQNDLRDLSPIGTLSIRVQQAQIRDGMLVTLSYSLQPRRLGDTRPHPSKLDHV